MLHRPPAMLGRVGVQCPLRWQGPWIVAECATRRLPGDMCATALMCVGSGCVDVSWSAYVGEIVYASVHLYTELRMPWPCVLLRLGVLFFGRL